MNEFRINNLEEKNQNANKKPFGFLNWIFKTEIFIILIILALKIIIGLIPIHTINTVKYSIRPKHELVDYKDYSYDNISSAINSNSFLADNEKEFCIESLKEEFDDNYLYIDLSLAEKRLSSFNIEYVYSEDDTVSGKYNSASNTIYIYSNNPNINFESTNKHTLFHELNHLISNDSLYNSMDSNPNILLETINEVFSRMYFTEADYDQSYDLFMPYAYRLCKLLSEENIKQYKFSGNEKCLIDGLLSIDNDIDKAYLLLDSINSLWTDYSIENQTKVTHIFEYYENISKNTQN